MEIAGYVLPSLMIGGFIGFCLGFHVASEQWRKH